MFPTAPGIIAQISPPEPAKPENGRPRCADPVALTGLIGRSLHHPTGKAHDCYHERSKGHGAPLWSFRDGLGASRPIRPLLNVRLMHLDELKRDLAGNIPRLGLFGIPFAFKNLIEGPAPTGQLHPARRRPADIGRNHGPEAWTWDPQWIGTSLGVEIASLTDPITKADP